METVDQHHSNGGAEEILVAEIRSHLSSVPVLIINAIVESNNKKPVISVIRNFTSGIYRVDKELAITIDLKYKTII